MAVPAGTVAYPTKLAEAFASRALEIYYETAVADKITNNDYEGEIRDKSSKLNILTFGALSLQNYTGTALTASDIGESNSLLTTDQAKAYYFKVKDLDTLKSYVKNPESPILRQVNNLIQETIDAYVLSFWADFGAGNMHGTDFTTGTCTVDVTTGVVTHSATGFLATMVGKGFKATGHTKWYRVKTYTDTSHIIIEDDYDDVASAYTGGAITAGTTFQIQALTPIQTTKALIYDHVNTLARYLNENKVPKADRFLVVPAGVSALMRSAPEFIPAVETAYNEVVKRGLIGQMGGFTVYENQQIVGDSVNGWRCLAGHKSAIVFGMAMTESKVETDLAGDFGTGYKGLTVYGAKVPDERRKSLAVGYWKL
jgi:hypothetical protein